MSQSARPRRLYFRSAAAPQSARCETGKSALRSATFFSPCFRPKEKVLAEEVDCPVKIIIADFIIQSYAMERIISGCSCMLEQNRDRTAKASRLARSGCLKIISGISAGRVRFHYLFEWRTPAKYDNDPRRPFIVCPLSSRIALFVSASKHDNDPSLYGSAFSAGVCEPNQKR